MKHILTLLFIFHFSFFTLSAQELPQGYFRNPMDHAIGLSATFAEFRTGHFHSGLDMRTGGAVGKPVYAAADGYVAKVSISPWGGGKILYIKHPNGYTTVYMHLNGYAGAIGKAVLREHYAQKSYSISKLFGPNELPVKKGQLVAYSGNTGGSGGPHLHFEIRRGGAADLHTHSTTINPLHFGLPYTDNIKPVIRGLRIYPEGGEGYEVGKDNIVSVSGPFHLGIYATDAAEGSTAKNGPDHVEVYLDGTLFFLYTTEAVPIDSSRMVNALLDYPLFARTRQAYLLTRALPGAEGPWVPVRMGDGIFRLKAGSTHHIGVKVYDIAGNCAERVVTVTSNPNTQNTPNNQKTQNTQPIIYNQPFDYQQSLFSIHLSPFTLYADDRLRCEAEGKTVTIQPTVNDIPPHQYYTLSIKGSLPGVPAEKTVVALVYRKPGSFKYTAHKTTHADGWHTSQVRDWGEFTLAADTTAPGAYPINFKDWAPLKGSTMKVKIFDDLAGVETYHCYLNGEWILGEYDGKTATVTIDASGKLKSGTNRLRVTVTDGTGNITDVTWAVTK
ncbi:MAG: M23 family metallopeptidase [Bacteroidales bacterium]|nr:M23 family metallopeptidase [Bacteroidales bacterium]